MATLRNELDNTREIMWIARCEKAEAEVERLKAVLLSALARLAEVGQECGVLRNCLRATVAQLREADDQLYSENIKTDCNDAIARAEALLAAQEEDRK